MSFTLAFTVKMNETFPTVYVNIVHLKANIHVPAILFSNFRLTTRAALPVCLVTKAWTQ